MAAPTYYTYKDPYPATLNHPHAVQVESTADWPKSYRYNSNPFVGQGIHPPAPVYQSSQPATQPWYYYGNQPQAPQPGYYVNGQYYPIPAPSGTTSSSYPYYYCYQPSTSTYYNFWQPPTSAPFQSSFNTNLPAQYAGMDPYSYMQYLVPGGPSILPAPNCPATMSAQAATAAATNAALAAAPQGPNYFVGASPTDFTAQQAYLASQWGWQKPSPTQLAPYKPSDGTQFWCKEMDGSWTLRSQNDILLGDVSPGHWERHNTSGYFYWVRQGV